MNKEIKRIFLFFLAFIFLVPIGYSAWVLTNEEDFSGDFITQETVSGLTEWVHSESEDETNKESHYIFNSGTTANSYTAIESDASYDSTNKIISLGYATKELVVKDNLSFTHSDSKINYTTSKYLDSSSFHTADGNTDYHYRYYSNKNNATNGTYSYMYKHTQWVNYYYSDHTYSYNNYASDGTYTNHTGIISSGRLYTIKLIGDVTISEGCTLDIGAFVGAATGSGWSGPVIEGNFVVLDLNGHTLTIEENATLNAYGYILDSKIDKSGNHIGLLDNYGTIVSGFIVEDYAGGGNTVATAAWGTSPFNYYSIPYLSCNTKFNYGSFLKTPTSLYPSNKFSKIVANFIGPSGSTSLIEINENSYVYHDAYNDPALLNTAAKFGAGFRTNYYFHGDIDVKTLELSIVIDAVLWDITKVINMAEFGFSIPPYVSINIEEGVTSLGMRIDFLPGSKLNVKKDATVDFTTLTTSNTLSGKSFTSDGGIRMLSLMKADSTYSYDGTSPAAGISSYAEYYRNEKVLNEAGNIDARANIYGNITVSNTSSSHDFCGKINLYNNSYDQIVNNPAFNLYSNSYEYYAYISGTSLLSNTTVEKIRSASSDQSVGSYTSLPLVSEGKVIKPSNISSLFNATTTYDFGDGVYFCNGKTYAKLPNNNTATDLNGNIVEVSYNQDNHYIDYNGKIYTYFRNIFVENASAADNNIYVKDDYYGDNATKTFNAIDFANNKVNYTYYYKATGDVTTEVYNFTRTKRLLGSWSIDDTTWNNYHNNPTQYYTNGSLTSTENASEQVTDNYPLASVITSNYIYSYTYSGIKYDYGSLVDYKNNILYSMVRRPFDGTKFKQVMTSTYHKMGTLKLSYSWDDKTETTLSGSSSDVTSSGIVNKTETFNITIVTNKNTVSAGSWTISGRSMYYMTNYSTAIRYVSDYGMWIKNTYTG